MDKQKQIEELAKELDYCETHDCIGKSCAKCRAIWLIENGYRKILEGSVVIPEKITEETSPETLIKIAKYNEKVRKQAVKEFAERLKRRIYSGFYSWQSSMTYEKFCKVEREALLIDEIAEEFGVEI